MVIENPTRRAVIVALRHGEKSAGELAKELDCPAPTLSHHLATLLAAALVHVRSDGPRRLYSLDPERALQEWDRYVAEGGQERRGRKPS